jgi:hypothetical protein
LPFSGSLKIKVFQHTGYQSGIEGVNRTHGVRDIRSATTLAT